MDTSNSVYPALFQSLRSAQETLLEAFEKGSFLVPTIRPALNAVIGFDFVLQTHLFAPWASWHPDKCDGFFCLWPGAIVYFHVAQPSIPQEDRQKTLDAFEGELIIADFKRLVCLTSDHLLRADDALRHVPKGHTMHIGIAAARKMLGRLETEVIGDLPDWQN
jgi:hypothetical protein